MREDVIRMAQEAGFREDEFTGGPRKGKVSIFDFGDVDIYSNLERFAALVAAAERERCAKVCDDMAELVDEENTPRASDASRLIDDCAAAIRALP